MSATDLMDKITTARGACVAFAPYFMRGLYRLRFIVDSSMPTAAIDKGWHVRFNPSFLDRLTDSEAAGLVMHEFFHGLNLHHSRLEGRDPRIGNVAADIMNNDAIREMGMTLPKGALYRETPGLEVPEYITDLIGVYDYLMAKGDDLPQGHEDLDNRAGEDVTEGDEGMIAKQVAADIQEYANRNPGRVPGSLVMWADSMLAKPQIRWQDVLRQAMRRSISTFIAGSDEATFARKARRQSPDARIVLPGRVRSLPRVAVIPDMSGSMFDAGPVVLGELAAIIDSCGHEVFAITCDSAVGMARKIKNAKEILMAKHGGGTDLAPAFEVAKAGKYACVIAITDGYMPAVRDRAIWVIVPGGERQSWMRGSVIVIPKQPAKGRG